MQNEDHGIGEGNKEGRGSHGEHGLTYFNHDMAHAPSKIGSQSHPMKASDSGSPPPTSATASGSTSTPTSVSGLSSGGSGQVKGESPPIVMHHSQETTNLEQNWSVSVPEPILAQTYPPHLQEKRYNPASYPSAIKLLVSNNVAGSIIGRQGQTISELQTQSSARIKLSQSGDFYPGTQDRVCLIQGKLENVKDALKLVLERLHMLQEQQFSQHLAWQTQQNENPPSSTRFTFVVKLLVPSSCCGMIIGKGGSNIKYMEETSGVSSVRLSPKESLDPSSPSTAVISGTLERIVTLNGPSLESCVKCSNIVLDGMKAHHDISRYANMTTSYSSSNYSRLAIPGSFTPVSPGGRPILVPGDGSMWENQGQYGQFVPKRSNPSPDFHGQMLWDQHGPTSRVQIDAIGAPISQEAMAFGPPGAFHEAQMRPSAAPTGQSHMYLVPSPSIEPLSLSNSPSATDLSVQLQESLHISNPPPSTGPVDFSSFGPQMPQPTPSDFTAQVFVPDTLIGSILGRGGKTLNELQMQSNTRIRISQRGEYLPGTRSRIVTIRGPTAQSVSYAQYLMNQRMVLPPTANFSSPALPPPQMQHMQRHLQHPIPTPGMQQQYEGHPSLYQLPTEGLQHPTSHGEDSKE